jgi:hypothetical protein
MAEEINVNTETERYFWPNIELEESLCQNSTIKSRSEQNMRRKTFSQTFSAKLLEKPDFLVRNSDR